MGDPNCYDNSYLNGCYTCPNGNSTHNCVIDTIRRKRIWNQSRMSSSMGLLKRKSMMVSKQVGQGACPQALGEAGGPGDLQSSIQKGKGFHVVGKAPCYNMGHLRNRVAYRNNVGVDRKHDSYQRYLARRVGGVLRKEKMPRVMNKTAYIGQPRTRTGTRCDCNKKLTTKKCLNSESLPKDLVCCENRIPNCNESSKFTGLLVKPRTGVAGSCRCCGK